jgi:hypothetical protein
MHVDMPTADENTSDVFQAVEEYIPSQEDLAMYEALRSPRTYKHWLPTPWGRALIDYQIS